MADLVAVDDGIVVSLHRVHHPMRFRRGAGVVRHDLQDRADRVPAQAGNHRFWLLSALCTHTKVS